MPMKAKSGTMTETYKERTKIPNNPMIKQEGNSRDKLPDLKEMWTE